MRIAAKTSRLLIASKELLFVELHKGLAGWAQKQNATHHGQGSERDEYLDTSSHLEIVSLFLPMDTTALPTHTYKQNPPRVELVQLPTPLHRLPRLSEELNLDLWIKRDDLTGFAFGGNKGRKLEYLIGEAISQKAQVITTCGSAQSNFIRQLATGCAMFGIECAAVVMQLPYEDKPAKGGLKPSGGNLLLDQLVGADIRIVPNDNWDSLIAQSESLREEYEAKGKKVFQIPIGGSTPQGAFGFFQAGLELQAQSLEDPFDYVVSASSSGSTQTGLTYAFAVTDTKYLGIACDPEPEMIHDFAVLSQALDDITGFGRPNVAGDFSFDLRFVGPGYGVPSEGALEAIEKLARTEGIFLDPIYSGKAFHGLLEMAKAGEIRGRVCFWHTGGTPALFAM